MTQLASDSEADVDRLPGEPSCPKNENICGSVLICGCRKICQEEDSTVIGTSFGPYRVLEKLGEGGMGEVYHARDAQLGRDVAIKILPPIFVSDPERLARFEHEARVLASLNHPNIAAIYAVEPIEGGRALILDSTTI